MARHHFKCFFFNLGNIEAKWNYAMINKYVENAANEKINKVLVVRRDWKNSREFSPSLRMVIHLVGGVSAFTNGSTFTNGSAFSVIDFTSVSGNLTSDFAAMFDFSSSCIFFIIFTDFSNNSAVASGIEDLPAPFLTPDRTPKNGIANEIVHNGVNVQMAVVIPPPNTVTASNDMRKAKARPNCEVIRINVGRVLVNALTGLGSLRVSTKFCGGPGTKYPS